MTCTNILFVVCHPDDEALWVGGLLHELSRFPEVVVHVICLSGAEDNSPRKAEFEAARAVAGYRSGVVMGGGLRPAGLPLPPVSDTVIAGLEKLGLPLQEIDVLFTHSPYGDEHLHPHHVQASKELFEWAKKRHIPFGYFSCIPLPNSNLEPVLRNMMRSGSLQLLNYAWCVYRPLQKIIKWFKGKERHYPRLYTQWLVDMNIKRKMLSCYQSIGLDQHNEGYAMFSSNVETLYVFDHRGVAVIDRIVASMEIPGAEDFFPGNWIIAGIKSRVIRRLRGHTAA